MLTNPFGLRVATQSDFDALLAFVLPIVEEDAAQTVSIRKISSLVERCIARDRALAAIVTSDSGEIEASIGATIESFDYTEESHLLVRWFGVAPAFRRTDRAARLVGFVRWLYETLRSNSDVAIPVFIATLTTAEQRPKVLLYQRRLPQVGVLHAFGCLPDRTFFNPARAGGKGKAARESPKGAEFVSPAIDLRPSA